jgi:putative phosphoesterase
MLIGVLADTHIPDRAKAIPGEILKAFKQVDMIVHAGDMVDLSVLNQLRSLCPTVICVAGNMDPDSVREVVRQKEIIPIGNFRIGVMHGWGSPQNLIKLLQENFKDDKVDAIIFGHSHHPFNEKVKGILFFNPGSATDKVFSSCASYGIIQVDKTIEGSIITF